MALSSGYSLESYKTRYMIFLVTVIACFAILAVRLWYMQIVKGEHYKHLSENNRIRARTIKATRGMIFDRTGDILVNNYPYFNLAMIPENVKDTDALLNRLATIIEIDKKPLKEKIYKERHKPAFKPVILIEDLKREQLARIEANKLNLPGIEIMVESVRYYQYKNLSSHVIGYLSEIDSKKLKSKKYEGYKSGNLIGNAGVERTYENLLKGRDGLKQIEVDAFGRELSSFTRDEAQPGSLLFLTLNAKLQQYTESIFKKKAGAAVVMNVRNGQVLAILSKPNYDPSLFVKGISSKNWKMLNEDELHPLRDKAIAGEYSPGSVFKVVVAAAALEEGVITKETTFKCTGSFKYGRSRFACWKKYGHGKVNVVDAITESCDVFFYNLGALLGIDLISEYAHKFGLGELTNIDLGFENPGLMPTTTWKKRAFELDWYGGETISAAIGQSYVLTTPLQIAVLTAAVANGRFIPVPQLLKRAENSDGTVIRRYVPQYKKSLKISKETLNLIREGLYGVVNGKKGTARGSKPKTVVIAGKTGTVQVYSAKNIKLPEDEEIPYELRDHAWFTAYAPYDKPEIAVTILVEHGGHGASAAAPIAKKIIDYYYNEIKGDDDHV